MKKFCSVVCTPAYKKLTLKQFTNWVGLHPSPHSYHSPCLSSNFAYCLLSLYVFIQALHLLLLDLIKTIQFARKHYAPHLSDKVKRTIRTFEEGRKEKPAKSKDVSVVPKYQNAEEKRDPCFYIIFVRHNYTSTRYLSPRVTCQD